MKHPPPPRDPRTHNLHYLSVPEDLPSINTDTAAENLRCCRKNVMGMGLACIQYLRMHYNSSKGCTHMPSYHIWIPVAVQVGPASYYVPGMNPCNNLLSEVGGPSSGTNHDPGRTCSWLKIASIQLIGWKSQAGLKLYKAHSYIESAHAILVASRVPPRCIACTDVRLTLACLWRLNIILRKSVAARSACLNVTDPCFCPLYSYLRLRREPRKLTAQLMKLQYLYSSIITRCDKKNYRQILWQNELIAVVKKQQISNNIII